MNLRNSFSLKTFLLLLFVVLTAVFAIRYFELRKEFIKRSYNWDKLMLILSQIDENYVDSIDHKALTEMAVPMILETLDPHSLYLPPQDLKDADEELDGNFDGIGIEFNVPNDTAVIVVVIPGGPSEKAGLLSGDRIVKIDGKIVAGVKINQDSLIRMMRGKSGSLVEVSVKRDGVKSLVPFKITRGKISVKSVDVAYMLDSKTGYIKLSKFSKNSYQEFMTAIEKLKKEGMKELIFDLRGNTGGYLDQALLLSNEFLKKGELIVYMQGKHRPRQDFFADSKGSCTDIGLKVLIDENSASSSEIFAGAMQDNDRATIIGRRSFGKGLVQEPINFTDRSGIRLTVAKFYTPSGRSIQKPFSKNYRYDIYERYKHGEMTQADSMKVDKKLKFTTKKGRTVYGGGGIVPDVFVPIDTIGINDFFIKLYNHGTIIKFSTKLADEHRSELRSIKSMKSLNDFFNKVNCEKRFLEYAALNKLVPKSTEWTECRKIALTQVKAYIGRYTPMEDEAYFPIISEIDNVIQKSLTGR